MKQIDFVIYRVNLHKKKLAKCIASALVVFFQCEMRLFYAIFLTYICYVYNVRNKKNKNDNL